MKIKDLLMELVKQKGSDLFYRAGGSPRIRIDGKVLPVSDKILSVEEVTKAVEDITSQEQREKFRLDRDLDFAIYMEEVDRRFRVSIFNQRNWPSIVVRNINNMTFTFEELNLPGDVLKKLCLERGGLVLLTGSMGSGKSTTIASMIEYINQNSHKHILTLEEPIEFTFKDKLSLINQRELGLDVANYAVALRTFTLQSPDVIYIGNIRDQETMAAAITAAETGVLVFSTLHTINASKSVERIINFFPPHQHQEVRTQLSSLLKGTISLRLLPRKDGSGRVPAYEVMLLTPTISRLIREGKVLEIPQYIADGSIFGMETFNQCLVRLIQENKITEDEALHYADNKDEFILALKGIKKA